MNPATLKNIVYIAIILCMVAFLTLFYKSCQNKRREQLSIEGVDKIHKSIEDSLMNTIDIENNLNTNITMKEINGGNNHKNDQTKEVQVDNSRIQDAPIITTIPDEGKPEKNKIEKTALEKKNTSTTTVIESPSTTDNTQTEATKEKLVKGYSVIAGSFGSQENAQQLVAKLKALGFDAFSKPSGSYTKVFVGSYDDKSAADDAVTKLKAKGITTIVKSN